MCKHYGCYSTNHSPEERQKARKEVRTYLAELEDPESSDNDEGTNTESEVGQDTPGTSVHFITTYLLNTRLEYRLTGDNTSTSDTGKTPEAAATQYHLDSYMMNTFRSVIPDTGAAKISTAGMQQFRALQAKTNATLDRNRRMRASVRFGDGPAREALGTTTLIFPFRTVVFHVLTTNTPFILCLEDMIRCGISCHNLRKEIHSDDGSIRIPLIKMDGHF